MKERHRQAILDAATELIDEREGPFFTADELADRAEVSRRTVFNHFASLDDVLLTVCTEILDVAAEQLRSATGSTPAGDGRREAMFTAMAGALRGADLADPIVRVWRALGATGPDDPRAQAFAQRAMSLVADELAAQLAANQPAADPLEVALLASSLTHGLGVVAGHWIAAARPGRAPRRADWPALLERLLDTVGSGYLPRT